MELQLFAANSLSKAMDAVQELYTQDHTWVTFKDTQYLSSGELNEQLAGGAYADVLISASKGKMDDGTPLEGKVNLQSSVGNVCKQAQSGAVDVAFVYSSDVYRFGGVKVIGVVPDDTHKNIIYPAAICKDSTQAEAANEFIEWATTNADAKKLWQEWGFELVS